MSARLSGATLLGLALVVVAVALSGCGDGIITPATAELDEEEELRAFIGDHGFFDETVVYGTEAMSTGGSGTREEIDPLTFWREVTERRVIRDVEIDHELGIAEVTISKELWGTLNIIDEDMVEYEKPMHHAGIRYAVFQRNDDLPPYGGEGNANGENHRYRHRRGRWTLTAISGLVASSVDTLTMSIDWIRVQSASVDVTITDPSLLMDVPDDIMRFDVGEEVTVTVSGPPEDAILFLHSRAHRSPFQYEGGVFVGTWTTARRGVHCAGVQALAHDSIFDSEYPDDCLVWAMPYEVGEEDED